MQKWKHLYFNVHVCILYMFFLHKIRCWLCGICSYLMWLCSSDARAEYLLHVIAYIGERWGEEPVTVWRRWVYHGSLNWPFDLWDKSSCCGERFHSVQQRVRADYLPQNTQKPPLNTRERLVCCMAPLSLWRHEKNILIQSFRETSGSIWTWEFVYCFKQMTCFLYFFIKCNAFISV